MNKTIGFETEIRPLTAADLIDMIKASREPEVRKRDMISAVRRICEMGSVTPAHFVITPDSVRTLMAGINPTAHGITPKTFSTLRSNFGAALKRAGIVDDQVRGRASKDPAWAPQGRQGRRVVSRLARKRSVGN